MPPGAPSVLQQDFTAGIRRNRSRDDLGRNVGANVLWNCRDWIIGRLGTPLAKRGGWGYQGSALASTPGRVRALADAPMNGGHYLIAVEADGTVQRSASPFTTFAIDGTTRNVGAILQNPVFLNDDIYYPSYNGTQTLSRSNETTVVEYLTGTRKPTYLCVYKNRLWGIYQENLCAGPPRAGSTGDPWDDNAYYGLTQPGKGIASVGGVMLIFYDGAIDRVTGSIPAGYGVTNDNIERATFSGDVGLIDAFSIVDWQQTLIWADNMGVWQTDGASKPLDLTWAGGAKDLYREFMANWTSSMRVASGIYSDLLFVTMTNISSNTFVDCLVCDLPRRVWYRVKNFPFTCFAKNGLGTPETWAGVETVVGRVATLSGILSPTSSNSSDADGTAVEADFETAYFRFGPGPQRVHDLFLGYEMDYLGTAAALTNQTITYTAKKTGTDGNLIKIALLAGTALSVAVVDDPTIADVKTINVTYDAGVTTQAQVTAAVNANAIAFALVSAAGGGGTAINALAATALSTGTHTAANLLVDFSTDPKANPTFGSYGSVVSLGATDYKGEEDRGYHWRKIPVRQKTPGLSVRVRMSGATAFTSVHSLGSEETQMPNYHQM